MFFLLRTIFWLSIVLALLPSGNSRPTPPAVSVSAVEAVTAAGAAMSDMSQFCERQPEACDVGAQAASAFGQRAQAGAKMVYDFISDRVAPSDTGSIGKAAKGSQNTLKPSDLQPGWRAPLPPQKEARSKQPAA